MKRYVKIFVAVAGTLASIAVVAAVVLWLIVSAGMCSNSGIAEYPSPDRTQRVVVFERNCGATTGFSTQASLLPSGVALLNESGNLFTAANGTAPGGPGGGPELRVSWENDKGLVLYHHPGAKVHLAATELNGIRITHAAFR